MKFVLFAILGQIKLFFSPTHTAFCYQAYLFLLQFCAVWKTLISQLTSSVCKSKFNHLSKYDLPFDYSNRFMLLAWEKMKGFRLEGKGCLKNANNGWDLNEKCWAALLGCVTHGNRKRKLKILASLSNEGDKNNAWWQPLELKEWPSMSLCKMWILEEIHYCLSKATLVRGLIHLNKKTRNALILCN